MLDSEVNAPFLLNEHGDPHFLFYKFNDNNILNNWEKNWQKSMATFFGKWNKCYRERHYGPNRPDVVNRTSIEPNRAQSLDWVWLGSVIELKRTRKKNLPIERKLGNRTLQQSNIIELTKKFQFDYVRLPNQSNSNRTIGFDWFLVRFRSIDYAGNRVSPNYVSFKG